MNNVAVLFMIGYSCSATIYICIYISVYIYVYIFRHACLWPAIE